MTESQTDTSTDNKASFTLTRVRVPVRVRVLFTGFTRTSGTFTVTRTSRKLVNWAPLMFGEIVS